VSLKPWWQGFKGRIDSVGDGSYITHGIAKFDDEKNTVTITELPVGVWTKDYKTFLDEIASVEKPAKDGEKVPKSMEHAYTDDGKPVLKGFDDLYTDDEVKFVLYFDEDAYEDMKAHPAEFEKRFRLTSTWRTSNMVAFDPDMKIVRYESVGHILESFYVPRLAAYEQRRLNEMERLEAEAVEADAKARFIKAVLAGTLELRRATDSDIVAAMKAHSLPALSDCSASASAADSVDGYDYLLRLRMDRVKATAVQDAEAAVAAARAAVAQLQTTTAAQLWLKDLVEFEAAWEKMVVQRTEASTGSNTKKVYAKKAVKAVNAVKA
jgi:DNA topoisomerase-2